jgi:hypothetical protein
MGPRDVGLFGSLAQPNQYKARAKHPASLAQWHERCSLLAKDGAIESPKQLAG